MSNVIELYVDGSCAGALQDVILGIAWVTATSESTIREITYGSIRPRLSEEQKLHAANIAELLAASKALEETSPDQPVRLYTDSTPVIDTLQSGKEKEGVLLPFSRRLIHASSSHSILTVEWRGKGGKNSFCPRAAHIFAYYASTGKSPAFFYKDPVKFRKLPEEILSVYP